EQSERRFPQPAQSTSITSGKTSHATTRSTTLPEPYPGQPLTLRRVPGPPVRAGYSWNGLGAGVVCRVFVGVVLHTRERVCVGVERLGVLPERGGRSAGGGVSSELLLIELDDVDVRLHPLRLRRPLRRTGSGRRKRAEQAVGLAERPGGEVDRAGVAAG